MVKKLLNFILASSISFSVFSQKVEAESGTLTGTVVENTRAGYSGTGYVSSFDNDNDAVTVQVQVAEAGLYDLFVGYAGPYGEKVNDVYVNGAFMGSQNFDNISTFTEGLFGKVSLNQGSNSIKVVKNWGWFELDYIRVEPAVPNDIHRIETTLVTENATAEAKVLYQYLSDIYGKKILSGQQGGDTELNRIQSVSGKSPAVRGFDLIDYSPSRVEHGTTSNETQKIIDWWNNQGGIATCAWHWNAPKDLIDTPGKEWWRGFYTDATTFDVSIAMNDSNSEEYTLIIRDIDAIAEQLKTIHDADVPLLWRPLHEAEGGWFWWGAKGPEPCKWLWKLLFERLTVHHGLNNLIWVWTGTASGNALDWYPGDEYIDIIGADIYLNDKNYSASFSMFDNMVGIHEGKKIITMSEDGTIPDPDALDSEGARWSWFVTWAGEFITDGVKNEASHINKVFNHEYVITLDELPDFDNYVSPPDDDDDEEVVTGTEDLKAGFTRLSPNPFADGFTISFRDYTVAQGVAVYNPLGQIKKRVPKEYLQPETTLDMSASPSGVYIVQVIFKNRIQTFRMQKR